MLKNNSPDQIANLFNLLFATDSFLTLLHIAKVIPIHKKESKLDHTSIVLFLFLQTLIRF